MLENHSTIEYISISGILLLGGSKVPTLKNISVNPQRPLEEWKKNSNVM